MRWPWARPREAKKTKINRTSSQHDMVLALALGLALALALALALTLALRLLLVAPQPVAALPPGCGDFEFALYFNEMPFMWRQNPQAPLQRTTFFLGIYVAFFHWCGRI